MSKNHVKWTSFPRGLSLPCENFRNSLVKNLSCQKQPVSDVYLFEFFWLRDLLHIGPVVSLTVKENPQDFLQCVK